MQLFTGSYLESTIRVDYRIKLELEGSSVGYLVQPAALSTPSSGARSSCSGPCPVEF